MIASTTVKSAERPVPDATARMGRALPWVLILTGKKWLWSDGSFAGILKSITEGVPNPKQYRSPMPPMGGAQLTPDQIKALTAYVWSLSH